MKRKIILLIILSIASCLNAQYLIYPKISADVISDLIFLNKNEAIYINTAGSIMKSTDGGLTWKLKKHFQGETLKEMKFIDEKIGIIRKSDGIIYTTDKGESWNTQNISISDAVTFLPFSESVMLKTTLNGKIERLNNFYNDWEIVYQTPTFIIPPEGCFQSREQNYGYISKLIKFSSGRILALGINTFAQQRNVLGDSLSFILKSDDTGITWDTLWAGLPQIINTVSFSDDQNGWMASGKDTYKSQDGGKNWEQLNQEWLNNNIYDLYSYDKDNIWGITGWGAATGKQFFRTTNAGGTWFTTNIEPTNNDKIIFIDKFTGFRYGNKILRTDDGGESWKMVDSSSDANIFSISFSTIMNGLVVCEKDGQKFLYRTLDGGKSWAKSFTQEKYPRQVKLINNNKGWLIASNKIYKTNTSGNSWEEKIISNNNFTYDGIVCYGENLAVLYNVKDAGTEEINNFSTSDGGQSWRKIIMDKFTYPNLLYDFQFTDSNHLFAMNRDGIWLSKDTSKTWEIIYKFNGSYGESYSFLNPNIGVVFYDYWSGAVTIDGGKTWREFNKISGMRASKCKLLTINYADEYQVYAIGEEGEIQLYHFYKNGDISFKSRIDSYTKQYLTDIDVIIENNIYQLWIAGYGFTVLKYDAGGIFLDIDEKESNVISYELFQNYPNPFNPETTIKYSIKEPSFTKLAIYNILGERIAELVNGYQQVGTYKVIFNAATLPSGIYFYKITSGNFNMSKKMILLK